MLTLFLNIKPISIHFPFYLLILMFRRNVHDNFWLWYSSKSDVTKGGSWFMHIWCSTKYYKENLAYNKTIDIIEYTRICLPISLHKDTSIQVAFKGPIIIINIMMYDSFQLWGLVFRLTKPFSSYSNVSKHVTHHLTSSHQRGLNVLLVKH